MSVYLAFGVGLTLVSRRKFNDPTRGKRIIEVYEGTPERILNSSALLSDIYTWELDDSKPACHRLTVSSPDDDSLQTIWEVHGNDLSKDIHEHPKTINSVGASNLALIDNWFETASRTDPPPTFTGSAQSQADSAELFRLLKLKVSSFSIAQFVLRRRFIIPASGALPVARFRLDVTGLIVRQEHIMPGGRLDLFMPAWVAQFLGEIDPEVPAAELADKYLWSWLVRSPTVTSIPGGKQEYRDEFWLALWSRYEYDEEGP